MGSIATGGFCYTHAGPARQTLAGCPNGHQPNQDRISAQNEKGRLL